MTKLNLTRKAVELPIYKNVEPAYVKSIQQDWLTMYDELQRYKKGLKEAVEDITVCSFSSEYYIEPQNAKNEKFYIEHLSVIKILQAHFPELKGE